VRQLLDFCRAEQARGCAHQVLARCAVPQALSGTESLALLDASLDALAEGLARNHGATLRAALQPLRLRSECMARLCTVLRAQAATDADLGRCIDIAARRLARIRTATAHLVQANQRPIRSGNYAGRDP